LILKMIKAHILLANDGFPRDKDMLDLYQGMQEFGYKINLYNATDVLAKNLPYEHGDIFCGTVNLCRFIWNQIGIKDPSLFLDYPEVLSDYLKRKINKTDLKHFKEVLKQNENNGNNFEYFIKPLKSKLFTGKTFRSLYDVQRDLSDISNNTSIYMTRVVNFLSE